MKRSYLPVALGAILASLTATFPAQAHHVMGGELPTTFIEGLLSGLAHPVIGLDHFAFVVGVGLAASTLANRFSLPAVFVAATIVGVFAHLTEMNIPFVEILIALSVLVAGVLLVSGRHYQSGVWMSLFAVAGLLHGYAYGESIVGAEPAPLLAYFLGFTVIQYGVAILTVIIAERLVDTARHTPSLVTRIGGGMVAGIGLTVFVNLIFPV